LRDHGRLHDQFLAVDRAGVARGAARGIRGPRWPAVADGRPPGRRGHARRPVAPALAGAVGRRRGPGGTGTWRGMSVGGRMLPRGLAALLPALLAACAATDPAEARPE